MQKETSGKKDEPGLLIVSAMAGDLPFMKKLAVRCSCLLQIVAEERGSRFAGVRAGRSVKSQRSSTSGG